jgi:hypothetical protein
MIRFRACKGFLFRWGCGWSVGWLTASRKNYQHPGDQQSPARNRLGMENIPNF